MKYYECPSCEKTYSVKEFREDRFCRKCGKYLQERLKKEPFEEIWDRILSYEGTKFHLINGEAFTYEITGNILHPSRTKWNIPKSHIMRSYNIVPFSGPGVISKEIMGPSYVWAILHDVRISLGEW